MKRGTWRRWTLGLWMCAVSWACDAGGRTQLVLVSDTDVPGVARVVFDVTTPRQKTLRATAPLGANAPGPRYLTLLHKGGPLGPVSVTVTGEDAGGAPLVTRRADLTFVPGKSLMVPLHLTRQCAAASCGAGTTCDPAGGCTDPEIDSGTLSEWRDGVPPGEQAGGTITVGAPGVDGGQDSGSGNGGERDGGTGGGQDSGTSNGGGQDSGTSNGGGQDAGTNPCAKGDFCRGQTFVECKAGAVARTIDCTQEDFGVCETGRCTPAGCVGAPAHDGRSCGQDAACDQGVCRTKCSDKSNCEPTCDGSARACELDCGGVSNCRPKCEQGECAIDCADSSDCRPVCGKGARCTIDCADASNCRAQCETQSRCVLYCTTDKNCEDALSCQGNARCERRCSDECD